MKTSEQITKELEELHYKSMKDMTENEREIHFQKIKDKHFERRRTIEREQGLEYSEPSWT